MLQIHTQRKIEYITVERATAWIVLAVLVETNGDQKTIIGKPRVVNVVLKAHSALTDGKVKKAQQLLALPAPISTSFAVTARIVSPFFPNVFGFSNSEFVMSLAARPPTVA
jgi:hypothetical protein